MDIDLDQLIDIVEADDAADAPLDRVSTAAAAQGPDGAASATTCSTTS